MPGGFMGRQESERKAEYARSACRAHRDSPAYRRGVIVALRASSVRREGGLAVPLDRGCGSLEVAKPIDFWPAE